MRHLLLALLTAAAALPFLASCSTSVEHGYGYYDSDRNYGPTPGYYSAYDRYPRYHEYHPYAHTYHHDADDHRRVVEEHHDNDVHGSITIER